MNIEELSVNSIRILSADAIQKANSGHPGLPLGAAPTIYQLWAHHMNHNSKNPNWVNRDRFILSAGHGSAMLYSLLHLFGYGDLSIEDLKEFRQLDSLTPGHPEYGHTVGVEATTGPLGAGMAMAVGMAISEAHLAAKFNKEGFNVVDHYTYVLGGDGCMMEGISSEAFSLAGTMGLDKLIVLYDSNNITIEGSTNIAFTEDVRKRFEAYGFQTLVVEDGNNLEELSKAIEEAKADTSRPSMITIKTEIGYGCPAKQGSASVHGEPLGVENIKELRKTLNWTYEEPFYIPEEVYENFKGIVDKNIDIENKWNEMFKEYSIRYPELKKQWDIYHNKEAASQFLEDEDFWAKELKDDATRNISGRVLNYIKDKLPNLIGGSADLGPSNKTLMSGEKSFSKDNYEGRNLHFGVRELAMTAIANGIWLHGGLTPYVSTFFVFVDYMKPMIRLSSIMGIPLIMVLTHDSIGVGEDGATHEPIEQLAMLRSLPNMNVIRPSDATETQAAWYLALTSKSTPTALILSRQSLPKLENTSKEALKGGYILEREKGNQIDGILIATGSELHLAVEVKAKLENEGINVRVVSMPCIEIFEKQSDEYKEYVLPKNIRARIVIEAGSKKSWGEYIGLDGAYVTINEFGASAPAAQLFERYGFTCENIVSTVKNLLN